LVPRLWGLTSLNSIIAEGVALWGIELFRTAKRHVDQGAPQAGPIPIRLYTTLYLVLGRAPPGRPGRPVTPACEEHCSDEVIGLAVAVKREHIVPWVFPGHWQVLQALWRCQFFNPAFSSIHGCGYWKRTGVYRAWHTPLSHQNLYPAVYLDSASLEIIEASTLGRKFIRMPGKRAQDRGYVSQPLIWWTRDHEVCALHQKTIRSLNRSDSGVTTILKSC
jgi:hypothetical protein